MPKNTTVSFSQVVEQLLDNSKPFSPVHLHRFSDLNSTDLAALKAVWNKIETNRRVSLLEDLEGLNEVDTLVCFDDFSFLALNDTDPRVRSSAIRLLWETNDTRFWHRLLDILQDDPDEIVRATAASGLGLYIYLGEIEEIPEEHFKAVEKALLDVMKSHEKVHVRQKSLEGLGFSSHKEVPPLISKAFASKDIDWRVSALFAMGRSADERWKGMIIEALHDPEPEVRFEAIRAAGELGLSETRQILMEMLVAPENRDDKEVIQAIIWSLSQIGGENVREAMSALLDQAEDEEEEEFINDALDNLGITDGMNIFGMMEFDVENGHGKHTHDHHAHDDDLDDEDSLEDENEFPGFMDEEDKEE